MLPGDSMLDERPQISAGAVPELGKDRIASPLARAAGGHRRGGAEPSSYADDDRAIRESLARALELEGYGVVTAADGVEALTRLRRDSFDALVVDVMMPHVDGLAICRVLRADGDRTPMLLLTARDGTRDRVAGLDAGADDYLAKPFSVRELLARLRALLRRAELTPGAGDERGRRTAEDRVAARRPGRPARLVGR